MINLKKLVTLACAVTILKFSFGDSCFSMLALTEPGEQVVVGSPAPGDRRGDAQDAEGKYPLAVEVHISEHAYQLPEDFSLEDHFHELLSDSVLGKTLLEREAGRESLEQFLHACRALGRVIRSLAEFRPVRRSGWCNRRKVVGPIRFAVEYAALHQDTKLVAMLLDYDFKWLEADGRFDAAHMLLPGPAYYDKLIHSDGYKSAARCGGCCTPARGFRAKICGVCVAVASLLGFVIASESGAFGTDGKQ